MSVAEATDVTEQQHVGTQLGATHAHAILDIREMVIHVLVQAHS